MTESYVPYSELKTRGHDVSSPGGARYAEMCKRVESLLADIAIHFENVNPPRITLHVARAYDDEWTVSQERGEELKSKDPESTWQEVSKDKIEKFQEYFTFADSEGWRFYLPAFMRHFLIQFPNGGYVAVCTAVRSPNDRMELLNQDQQRCVSEFASLCDEYGVWSP